MKKEQQKKTNMKNETVTSVFSSSFPINIFFFFKYFLLFSFTHILVALQKSLEVMCRFITTMADERNYRDSWRWRVTYSYFVLTSVQCWRNTEKEAVVNVKLWGKFEKN